METILDLGVDDAFTARVASNVVSRKILGSLEYATAVVGSKLIVVLGHTKCGAVHAAVKGLGLSPGSVLEGVGAIAGVSLGFRG